MPNYCDYSMRAKGKRDAVLKLNDWLSAHYDYTDGKNEVWIDMPNNQRLDTEHHIGYRVFECYCNNYDELKDANEDDIVVADMWGECAWSCACCMRSIPLSYLNDTKNEPNRKAISLPEACRRLGVEVELFSEEAGCQFSEHWIIEEDGTLSKDDCEYFYDVYIEEYETFNDYVKDCEDNGWDIHLTEEQFNSTRESGESSIRISPNLDRYGDYRWERL